MARFKFGKKKKDAEDISLNGDERHSYLRRPSVSSRTDNFASEATSINESAHSVHDEREAQDHDYAYNQAPLGEVSATTPWKRHRLVDSPFPRYRHAASAISSDKNEIYIMGGLKDGSVFGDTWKIVPQISATGAIEVLEPQHIDVANQNNPPARVGHASVLCGNAYIVYGGDTVDTDYNGFPDDNFYMFNINNRKYTIPSHILNKPRGRYGHSIGVVSVSPASSRLYLFGGQLENDVYSDLYYFELTSFKSPKARWELVEPANHLKPPPLTNHSMCVYKNKIYVFGGVYNNEKVSNDVWCFDTSANKWSQLVTSGDVPSPVNEHAACIVGDRLYVYGGNDFSGVIYDTLSCLNLHTLKWSRLAKDYSVNGPGPRCGHSLTYLPKLNKLLVMGGDKNDYISPNPSDFDTFEELNGEEFGTMVYELDLPLADHFMGGGQPKKLAASAGGAAGVLNRRASPSPSMEDAFTRHRRSMSNGVDDFRTPNASVEPVNRSLDPNRVEDKDELPEPQEMAPEKFVDVPSSGAQSEINDSTSVVDDVRGKYGDEEDFEYSEFHNGSTFNHSVDEDRSLNNDTPVLSHTFEPETPEHYAKEQNVFSTPARGADTVGAAAGISALRAKNSLKSEYSASRGISSPIRSDDNAKRIIAELKAELKELKSSRAAETDTASKRIQAVEAEAKSLRNQHEKSLSLANENHAKLLSEKDSMIQELLSATNPDALEAPVEGVEGAEPTARGFTELTRHKLRALDLSNKLLYLQNENSQLKEKHASFEPFMNNQMNELASLQKVIKRQEDRIAELTSQVKSESVLRSEIAQWKHKYEDLELEFNTYRALNAEIVVSDDEDAVDGEPGKRSAAQLSSKLDNLVSLWSTASATTATRAPEDEMVPQLQKQLDDLMVTSQAQHEGASAEVQKLEEELQAKLLSLKTFEENYRDALQSVQNTSRALDLTQDELKNQKLTMEKLVKENNELKIFKKAARKSPSGTRSPSEAQTPLENGADGEDYDDVQFNAAHYNMKVKDLEADLYILRQEKDQLNDTVSSLKKELYLAKSQ